MEFGHSSWSLPLLRYVCLKTSFIARFYLLQFKVQLYVYIYTVIEAYLNLLLNTNFIPYETECEQTSVRFISPYPIIFNIERTADDCRLSQSEIE